MYGLVSSNTVILRSEATKNLDFQNEILHFAQDDGGFVRCS